MSTLLLVNWVGLCIEDSTQGDMNFLDKEELSPNHVILLNLWESCSDIVKSVDDRFTVYAYNKGGDAHVDIELKAWSNGDAQLQEVDALFSDFGFRRDEPDAKPFDVTKVEGEERRLYTYILDSSHLTAMQLMGTAQYLMSRVKEKNLDGNVINIYRGDDGC